MTDQQEAGGLEPVHRMAATKLAAAGQRYTTNRRAVVRALADAAGPLTIAEILNDQDDLAQSSAYRSLAELEDVGVVNRIITSDDHARFELAEEITGHHHHHLICHGCGSIIDVTLAPRLEADLEAALNAVATENGFEGEHHRVDLIGRCAACR